MSIVALGGEIPDTMQSVVFAKKGYGSLAVANALGSKVVNIGVGLGLPWMVAAFYWVFVGNGDEWRQRYANEPWYSPSMPVGFAVPAGTLGFSVMVFSTTALFNRSESNATEPLSVASGTV